MGQLAKTRYGFSIELVVLSQCFENLFNDLLS
jgi:hypothetical protein